MDELAEAIVDLDGRGRLPEILCRRLNTRSAVLLWRSSHDDLQELDSNYFDQGMVEAYGSGLYGADPWVAPAFDPRHLGRVVHHESLVPHETYVASSFYNDFIRASGDDTCRCLGLTARTPWGTGALFVHRGARHRPFTEGEVAAAGPLLQDAFKGLVLRARLARAGAGLGEAALDRLAAAVIVVRAGGRVARMNASAEEGVRRGALPGVRQGVLAQEDGALQASIGAATAPAAPRGSLVELRAPAWGRPLQAVVAPIAPGAAMILFEPSGEASDRAAALCAALGLSRSEARVALGLADGLTPAEIAAARRVAVETVRRQIKSVAQKLGVGRQAQIVACVQRALAVRPGD